MNTLSQFGMDQVTMAHFMVVGCGALGNEVLKNLVLSGAHHLVVVDFDRVESDNLSRSVLFSRQDAQEERYKVDAIADHLRQMNPDINVQTLVGDIAYDVGLGLIREMDVVIGCVDNRWARYCINRLCMRAGIPWVDGGIDGLEGTARVFIPGENCYACNLGPEGLNDLARRMPCAGIIRRNIEAGKSPTTSMVASIIGAVQVQEALKLIHRPNLQHGDFASLCGKMFYYEGLHLTTKTVDFKAFDDDCPVHERWEPVKKSMVTAQTTVVEALSTLQTELQTKELHIRLIDDCFVDYVEERENGNCVEVMSAGHLVEKKLSTDRRLLTGNFYQHEWREIDRAFPYQHLMLAELGIPSRAVLPVYTENNDCYIEIE